MPLNRAFAPDVSIDSVWRKEPEETYKSPTSEPIPPGESFSMSQIVDMAHNQIQDRWREFND